jgi:hypothetical protein
VPALEEKKAIFNEMTNTNLLLVFHVGPVENNSWAQLLTCSKKSLDIIRNNKVNHSWLALAQANPLNHIRPDNKKAEYNISQDWLGPKKQMLLNTAEIYGVGQNREILILKLNIKTES